MIDQNRVPVPLTRRDHHAELTCLSIVGCHDTSRGRRGSQRHVRLSFTVAGGMQVQGMDIQLDEYTRLYPRTYLTFHVVMGT